MHCANDEIVVKNIIANTSIWYCFFFTDKVFQRCDLTVVSCLFVWPGHWAYVLQKKTHFTFKNAQNRLNYS